MQFLSSHTPRPRFVLWLSLFVSILTGCGDDAPPCSVAAPDALRVCMAAYGDAIAGCYAEGNASCDADDATLAAALAALESSTRASCTDDAAGSGPLFGLTTDALVGRLQAACSSEAASLAWRSYGGPHGSAWAGGNDGVRACLALAHQGAMGVMDESLRSINTCLDSGACDAASVSTARTAAATAATEELTSSCLLLNSMIALDPATYVERAAHQVDCLTAVAHDVTEPLDLDCGPSHAQFDVPRGEWQQITVDGDEWGTLCGDGTPYAFWVQLAPEGQPLDRVFVGLQGGGVCVLGDDCSARFDAAPDLFNAMFDLPLGGGIASDDPDVSDFANWTRVYLPYCNQDVFAGGGVTEDLGSIQVPRYGSVNLRAAVSMVRDVLWRELDDEGGAGFRPDQLTAVVGGWSAGAYGTMYNYHWFLDDLQWPRTIAFPDAGLALDNGEFAGVATLGNQKIMAWGIITNLPPYCFTGRCAVGPNLLEAISPRLLQVPQQQMLILTNPRDTIQQGDAFFSDEAVWINAVRQAYCDTRDLPGIHYYITSQSSEAVHVVSPRDEFWTGSVAGETMRDWFTRAIEEPGTMVDRVEEADFVADVPGVEPYPCSVDP